MRYVVVDRVAFSLDDSLRILISEHAHGQTQTELLLLGFTGELLRLPQRWAPTPNSTFLDWHRDQVFRGPPRLGR